MNSPRYDDFVLIKLFSQLQDKHKDVLCIAIVRDFAAEIQDRSLRDIHRQTIEAKERYAQTLLFSGL